MDPTEPVVFPVAPTRPRATERERIEPKTAAPKLPRNLALANETERTAAETLPEPLA